LHLIPLDISHILLAAFHHVSFDVLFCLLS
jgi:hypothetical protein